MLITISTNPTMKMDLTENEIDILDYTYSIIKDVETMVIYEGIDDVLITSQKTGECFDLTELQRILGVIDSIISNAGDSWELKSKKDI